jgi:hypothetical protein
MDKHDADPVHLHEPQVASSDGSSVHLRPAQEDTRMLTNFSQNPTPLSRRSRQPSRQVPRSGRFFTRMANLTEAGFVEGR